MSVAAQDISYHALVYNKRCPISSTYLRASFFGRTTKNAALKKPFHKTFSFKILIQILRWLLKKIRTLCTVKSSKLFLAYNKLQLVHGNFALFAEVWWTWPLPTKSQLKLTIFCKLLPTQKRFRPKIHLSNMIIILNEELHVISLLN
jgi:hypothetical protein